MSDPPTNPRPQLRLARQQGVPIAAERTESIASLIDRLQYPPEIVVQDWLDQMTRIIGDLDAAAVCDAAEPLSQASLTTRDFGVDADNRLVPLSFNLPSPAPEGVPERLSATGQRAFEAFAAAVRPPPIAAVPPRRRVSLVRDGRPDQPASARRPRRHSKRPWILVGAGLAGGLAVTAGLLFRQRDERALEAGEKTIASPRNNAPSDEADLPLTTFAPIDLAAAGSESLAEDSAPHAAPDQITATLPPLTLPPLEMDPSSSELATADGSAPDDMAGGDGAAEDGSWAGIAAAGLRLPASGQTDAASNDPAQQAAALEADDSASEPQTWKIPDAEDDVAQQVTGSGIALPPRDDPSVWVLLSPRRAARLVLDFPSGEAAVVRQEGSIDQWQVVCETAAAAGGAAVAEIRSAAGGTRFRWTESASRIAAARRVHRGRLRVTSADGAADDVFLCQHVQIDPIPFSFQRSDLRAAWPLGDPPDPAAARLEIDFQLPEEIQYGWVEPLQGQGLRRATAVAHFSLSDEEFVGVQARIDVQLAARLACRVRTAARLDPTLPWQPVSLEGVTRWADQIATAALATERALMRIAALYDLADSRERAALRLRRRALQSQGETLTLATERLGKLIQLMRQLQDESAIRCELTARWPDGTVQPILSTAEDLPE